MNEEFNISFRQGKNEDLNELRELALISYGVFNGVLTSGNWKIMRDRLERRELIEQLLSVSDTFVCTRNQKIIGMAFLTPAGEATEIYEAGWSVIRMLGVHPDHTGKGIAKKLTQLCIEQARVNGEKIIALHTSPEIMQNAIHVYEKSGFRFYKDIAPIFGVKYQVFMLTL